MALLCRAVALFIIALVFASVLVSAADRPDSLRESVLVLRNGRVMQGRIAAVGDQFIVGLGERSEVRIPAHQVEMHCRDLSEAYERRRERIPPDSAAAHFDLAEWCLRENLLEFARREIARGEALEPNQPRLPQLKLRLELLAQPAAPEREPEIAPQPRVVSADEIADVVQQLPVVAVSSFATTIQPLMLNHCGTCHGPTSNSSFRLLRPAWAKSLPQRLTQRNLHTTLSLVDRESPEASPLLSIGLKPHGGAELPIFENTDHYQWQQLRAWVLQLATPSRETRPVAFASPDTILSRNTPHIAARPAELPGREPQSAMPGVNSPRTLPPPTSVGAAPLTAAPATLSPVKLPSAKQPYQPRDPFDPEIFNRRFFPDSR
ncbi:MAG: hypothetical protein KDA38_11470 [Planctomycetales bacterium]|nr:hypothetical protein [Planctomycetales bacterium]